jgi:hypothetical protein
VFPQHKCSCLKGGNYQLAAEAEMQEHTLQCSIPDTSPWFCISSSMGHLKAGYLFSRSKSPGWVPYVQEPTREGAGLCTGAPSQSLSYLFWHRFSGMRPCLEGIFSRFDSLGPTKMHSFVFTIHHSL